MTRGQGQPMWLGAKDRMEEQPQSVVIITAFPNLLTGDEISRLIDAGRINSDDARRIVEGQATPEELAQLKVAVLQLNSSSSNAALASQQPKGNLKLSESTACDVNPCRNGGVCSTPDVLNKDTTLCTCPRGYYGEFCDYDSPECEMEPCLNNGECQRSNALPRGYICICPTGFLGDNCEVTLRTDDTSTVKSAPLGVQKVTAQAQTVLFRPAAIIAFLCIIFFLLGMAFIATVEADRKVLTERYRVLISVGYRVDYPAIEFNRLAAIRIRFLCCCCCNMIPCCTCGVYQDDDDDDAIPLPPHMRDVDPCAQLRSIVQAASLNRTPSQPSLYGRAVMVEGDGGNRGYP